MSNFFQAKEGIKKLDGSAAVRREENEVNALITVKQKRIRGKWHYVR
jgi:hypothetical protein